ncbi:MAG: hypothetical protein WBB67_01790 [bacterium]
MSSFDIAWSILGIISFLFFMLFYKRLKPGPFWGKMHPAETWAMGQLIFGSPRAGTLTYELIKGNDVNILSILISIGVFALTGIFMMILARKLKQKTLSKGLKDNIDEYLEKLGDKQ